jgi:hypothetical protein
MSSTVTLEVTNGPLSGQKFHIDRGMQCTIGRGKNCTIQVPDDYGRVSRQHCVLEFDPPHIRVTDLGSLNGTYRNGECVGRRDKGSSPERQSRTVPHHELKDQDELLLGGMSSSGQQSLTLRIHASPVLIRICGVCGNEAEVPDASAVFARFVCPVCREDREALQRHLEASDDVDAGLGVIANYELLQKIGRGGFGSVFLARHCVTGQKVALKVMLPHIAQDPMMRQIFEREIENMKALRHPNIVELFEEGCEGGIYYFTMEYCALGSVSSLLRQRGGTLPVGQALELIHQAIDGLDYAHHAIIPNVRLANGTYASGAGIVHRDIKPCNLLICQGTNRAVLKVGDYGMSKAWEQAGYSGITRPGTRAGSFAYQPRQQVRGYRDSQPEVDVWALAATLYFMLTGSTPRDFPPNIAPELVVLQHPVVKIRHRNPAIPKRLAEVIDDALEENPDLRVKEMAVFKRNLKSAT